jgi:FkbM family methyltransferase
MVEDAKKYMVEAANVVFELNGRNVAFSMLQNINWRYPASPCYEPDVVHAMTRFVRPGDHVVDAGANWGYHSLLMSRLVGSEGVVWAIEPDQYNFQVLNRNVRINNLTNIMVCDKPLWNEIEEREFNCADYTGSSSLISSLLPFVTEKESLIKRTTAKLDDIIPTDVHIRLLKIDCEGAEQNILKGATRLLKENAIDVVIVELNLQIMPHFGWTVQSLRAYMESFRYDFFLLNVNGFFPIYIPPAVEFNFSSCVLNVLFARLATVAEGWPVVNLTSLGPIYMGSYAIENGMVQQLAWEPKQ